MTRYNTGQIGEYLVAAELARRGHTVALLTGNAPAIDILAYKDGKAVAVQVKAVRSGSHQFDLKKFVDINFTEDGGQEVIGPRRDIDRSVHVALVFVGTAYGEDEVLWTTLGDLADLLAQGHSDYLARNGGRRPGRNPRSTHSAISKEMFRERLRSPYSGE